MVENMLQFLRAVRTSNWELHIAALQDFSKYFFAMDQINYARMIPWYIHEVLEIKENDNELWEDFQKGNWVANRSSIPFCALGADEALEHENRRMKVLGGLTGITQNPQALNRFFLISPELARISSEAKEMFNLSSSSKNQHHAFNENIRRRHQTNVERLSIFLNQSGNPFLYEDGLLINIVTKCVFPENISNDMCQMTVRGKKAYNTFVRERIQGSGKSIWDPLEKLNLKLCKSNNKKIKLKIKDTVVELKEDVNLLSKLLIVSKSRPEFDLKSVVSKYELSAVPRSLYSSDGEMHHGSAKSKLMHLLENMVEMTRTYSNNDLASICPETDNSIEVIKKTVDLKVAIVDAMAEVQMLDKPDYVKTCKDLAHYFFSKIKNKYKGFGEVHIIFDTYRESSLKNWTRKNRQAGVSAIHYRITAETNIIHITLKKLLSHSKTKRELTDFFSRQILELAKTENARYIVSWENNICSTDDTINVTTLNNNHEEADTKIILHATFVSQRLPECNINIFSPDTDVFILAPSNYEKLSDKTIFETGKGDSKRQICLKPIFEKLGKEKAAALCGLHSISGADITGSFFKKGKLAHFKAFCGADTEILEGLASLGEGEFISETTYT